MSAFSFLTLYLQQVLGHSALRDAVLLVVARTPAAVSRGRTV
jgi:hypothetical protein